MLEIIFTNKPQFAGGSPLIIIGVLVLLSLIFGKSNTSIPEEDENTKKMRLDEAEKKAAQKKVQAMRNKYFFKNSATGSIKGPFEKQEIIEMLNMGTINFDSLLRKGIDNENFNPLQKYPELIGHLNDFI